MEFALVAPLLFLFVMGMFEIGRMVMVQQVLTNAAREGARFAVMPNVTESAVEARVANFAASAGVSGVEAEVEPAPEAAGAGETVTVTASVPVSSVGWLPTRWFVGSGQLQSLTAMRKEGIE